MLQLSPFGDIVHIDIFQVTIMETVQDLWIATSYNHSTRNLGVAVGHPKQGIIRMGCKFNFDSLCIDMGILCALHTVEENCVVRINSASAGPRHPLEDLKRGMVRIFPGIFVGKMLQCTLNQMKNCNINASFYHLPRNKKTTENQMLRRAANSAMNQIESKSSLMKMEFSIPRTDAEVYILASEELDKLCFVPLPQHSALVFTKEVIDKDDIDTISCKGSNKTSSVEGSVIGFPINKQSNHGNLFAVCISCTRMVMIKCQMEHALARYVGICDGLKNAMIVTTCRICIVKVLCDDDESVEERSCCMADAFWELNMSSGCLKNTIFHESMLSLSHGSCKMEDRKGRLKYLSIPVLVSMCNSECEFYNVTSQGKLENCSIYGPDSIDFL